METSLRNAMLWGANAVLLVPAVVNAQTPYKQAWERSQKVIQERILPLAQELKVIIAIEEVWNKFLLSPLELASYVDGFKSPWVQAYFDVGNIVRYGFPQDWIRTLGKRIVKVHLKDFAEKDSCAQWKNIGEGAVNWPEVRRAFSEVGYGGYVTCEIEGGNLEYLRDVAQRVDRFIAGQAPYQKP
jgi:hexulose-6-phosphate isomerase